MLEYSVKSVIFSKTRTQKQGNRIALKLNINCEVLDIVFNQMAIN